MLKELKDLCHATKLSLQRYKSGCHSIQEAVTSKEISNRQNDTKEMMINMVAYYVDYYELETFTLLFPDFRSGTRHHLHLAAVLQGYLASKNC